MKQYSLIGVLSIFLLFAGCTGQEDGFPDDVLVRWVIDGDTFELAGGKRVRLLGIDTPEVRENKRLYYQAQRSKKDIQTIMRMGKQSSDFMRNLVEGKRVRLEFDVEKYDKYNRLLCYVYLKDGTFVNLEIIREGYASLLSIPPNLKYVDLFKQTYRKARENKKGFWQDN